MIPSPSTPSPSSSSGLYFRGKAAGVIKVLSRVMAGGDMENSTQSQETVIGMGRKVVGDGKDQDFETLQWCKEALAILEEKITQLTCKKGFEKEFYMLDSEACREADNVVATAIRNSNRSKNRYSDVLPFDEFRVVLRGDHHSRLDGTDYINASHIMDPSPMVLPRFIATQGPLENTVADFWDMARQEQCVAVLSLTRLTEGHRVKCSHYFPLNQGEVEVYGHVRVVNKMTTVIQPHIVERILEVHETGNNCPPYQLSHYQYSEWPDHGVPLSTTSIRGLIRLLRNSQKSLGPFLVHCSAGIGRTGTYCTIDHTIRRLLHRDKSALDISATVRHFREQRMGMVQTKEQFRFCFFAIRDELQDIVASGKIR